MKHNLQVEENNTKEMELQIKLFINQNLYNSGHITDEMYQKAKEKIRKTIDNTSAFMYNDA